MAPEWDVFVITKLCFAQNSVKCFFYWFLRPTLWILAFCIIYKHLLPSLANTNIANMQIAILSLFIYNSKNLSFLSFNISRHFFNFLRYFLIVVIIIQSCILSLPSCPFAGLDHWICTASPIFERVSIP